MILFEGSCESRASKNKLNKHGITLDAPSGFRKKRVIDEEDSDISTSESDHEHTRSE